MLAIGTKLSVWPVAGVVPVAKDAGARVVILNAEPTDMDGLADAVLRGPIGEILPAARWRVIPSRFRTNQRPGTSCGPLKTSENTGRLRLVRLLPLPGPR